MGPIWIGLRRGFEIVQPVDEMLPSSRDETLDELSLLPAGQAVLL